MYIYTAMNWGCGGGGGGGGTNGIGGGNGNGWQHCGWLRFLFCPQQLPIISFFFFCLFVN